VRARPVSPAERAWLWCRRRPALAAALAACALLLLTLAIGGPLAALSIQRSRVAAERAEAGGREQLRAALLAQARAMRLTGRPGQREEALAAVREAVRLRPGPDARREAVAALALPDVTGWRRLDLHGATAAFDADLRRYVTNDAAGNLHVRAVADDRPLHFLPAHRQPDGSPARVAQFGFSAEGDELGVSQYHGDLVVWRLDAQPDYAAAQAAGGAALARPEPARPRVLRLPHGARDGATVPGTRWFASDAADGAVRFYDRDTFQEAHRLAGPLRLAAVKFSPRGGRFAELAGSTVRIRDLLTGEVLREWSLGLPGEGHVWHPDGAQLVTWSLNRAVQWWNADTGEPAGTLTAHDGAVVGAAFDAAGRWLVTQSWDNDTILWCAVRQQPALRLAGAGNGLRFSDDGRRVAYQAWADDAWRIGELAEVAAFTRLETPPAAATPAGGRDLWGVTFSDAGVLVGAGTDGFGVWRLEGPSFARFVPSPDLRRPVALPGGRLLLVQDNQPRIRSWRPGAPADGTPEEATPLPPLPEPIRDQAVSADGARIAVTGRSAGALRVLDGPAAAWRTVAEAGLVRVTLDAAGRQVAASLEAGGAALWDAATGTRRREFAAERCDVLHLSPDGRWLVAGTVRRFIVWDTADGRAVHEHARRTVNLPAAAWSADGRRLLVHDADGAVRLLAAGTWEEVAELPAPPLVRIPAFSPEGRWLAVPGEKSGVDLWNLEALQAQLAELGPGSGW
jgi:WD40 repeat protein